MIKIFYQSIINHRVIGVPRYENLVFVFREISTLPNRKLPQGIVNLIDQYQAASFIETKTHTKSLAFSTWFTKLIVINNASHPNFDIGKDQNEC